ncbi:hypothetical protein Btru_025289 [Bulinus truncatus]|nr:hypothetical protein Btru_025289 [Bulinus truncatus]
MNSLMHHQSKPRKSRMTKTTEAVTPRSILFLICLYSRFITADTAIYFPVTTKISSINENFAPGEIVTNCTATNNDGNVTENLIYSLVNSQSTPTYFQVIYNTGNIILQRDLHRDSSDVYVVQITASDRYNVSLSAYNTCNVTINVSRNLHSPIFVKTTYDTTLNRTVNLGTPVVSLTASDADTLIPFNNIAVRAYDGGSPPLSAYNVFAVMFRNSYPPIFSSAKYTIIINEAVPVPSQVIIINATVGDEPGPESTVLYQIIGGGKLNGTNYFSLNSVTGVLTLINNTNLVNINKATVRE